MLQRISNIFEIFRDCFSRVRPYCCFIIVILAFMTSSESMCLTAVIRTLWLNAVVYEGLLHFFSASSYSLEKIQSKWIEWVAGREECTRINGRLILPGDHTKVGKEARRMPGVKARHQDSGNFGKAPTIYGHHFGTAGIIIEDQSKYHCVPLALEIHEGTEETLLWTGQEKQPRTTRMARMHTAVTEKIGESTYSVLDRDFCCQNVLNCFTEFNEIHEKDGLRADAVIRCKNNITIKRLLTEEEQQKARTGKRGRPPKWFRLKINKLFTAQRDNFQKITAEHGKRQREIEYFSIILEWQGIKLLFVLTIEANGKQSIFCCTDLNIDPIDVISLYDLRFSIEETFKELKSAIGAFDYRFWNKNFEKLNRFRKNRLERIPPGKRKTVLACLERIERFVNFAAAALGILQILSIELDGIVDIRNFRFQRTYKPDRRLSIYLVKEIIRHILLVSLEKEPDNDLKKAIQTFRLEPEALKRASLLK